MRVVHLINGLVRGGGERLLVDLVTHLDRRRYAPTVYLLTRGGPLAAELARLNVPVRRLTWLGFPTCWRWPAFLLDLLRADALHTHFYYADLVGSVLGRLFAVPRRLSTRHDTGFWMSRRHRVLEPWIYRGFHQVLCVSAAVEAGLRGRGVAPERLCVVFPGVPAVGPAKSSGRSRPTGAIVAVGRLETVKGHDLLLSAFAELCERLPAAELRLLLIGAGSALPALRRLAARLEIRDRVTFYGALPRPEVSNHLAEARLYVLPSRAEAAPLSLLEAMAAGLPCIATAVGGVPEILTHAENGWLVPPEDPEALAAAMYALLTDAERARKLGAAARRTVAERFSLAAYIDAVVSCYAGR
ncbi:MAG: glycosyltransferase [Deltaproteobacteria bacterium]|nr:glycosyltransferase [Deltaproteobacteria bacterium]